MSTPSSDTQGLYQPLPSDTIRCLRLVGTSLTGDPGSPRDLAIDCRLETINLADVRQGKVHYHALSYVWGSPRFSRWIICNGIRISVTPNLYEALWHFTFGPESSFLLWADALCINQGDNNDKQQQVSLMASIYREADVVHVWLGKEPTTNPLLEQFWDSLNSGLPQTSVSDKEIFRSGITFLNSAAWFTRVWTVQEIVLARKARVHSGFSSVDWDLITELPRIVAKHRVSSPFSSATSDISLGRSAYASVMPAIEALSRLQRSSVESSLFDLIRATCGRAATDPRDKIYGLLGIWAGRDSLRPDYKLSIVQTQAHAIFAILKEENWLWLNLKSIKALAYSEGQSQFRGQRPLMAEWHPVPVTWIPNMEEFADIANGTPAEDFDVSEFQGPKWPEPCFRAIHPMFTPKYELQGIDLVARGVILGTWRQTHASEQDMWQYQGNGVFEGFPP